MSMFSRNVLSAAALLLPLAAIESTAAAEPAKQPPGLSLQVYDQVQPVEFSWGWIRWLMNSEIDPQAEMTLGLVYIKPHQTNPLHRHATSAEYLHVLSGCCEHRVGDRWVTLNAGDTLRIPKGEVHCARTGAAPCQVVVVYDTGTRQMQTLDAEPAVK